MYVDRVPYSTTKHSAIRTGLTIEFLSLEACVQNEVLAAFLTCATKMPSIHHLIEPEYVRVNLTHDAAWHESHGAEDSFLGPGIVYYALPYLSDAKVCVCLGSGGGFVPRLMAQAQRDLNADPGRSKMRRTILVDANLPEAGWGGPQWLAETSHFRTAFPEVEIRLERTTEAIDHLKNLTIDYLHIDADHSYDGCIQDWDLYSPLVGRNGFITLHDTMSANPRFGVKRLLDELRDTGRYDVLNLPYGEGTAILRMR